MSLVGWIAGTVLACDVLLLFPSAFWWVTGTVLLPLPLARHFDPNGEANLFTWYSSLLLILASMTALVNFGLDSIRAKEAGWRRYAWLWLSVVTLFLSLDEVATIHESIDRLVRQRLQGGGAWASWVAQYGKTWIITYSPGIVVVVGSFLLIFLRLWGGPRGISLCAVAGLTLWITAVGLEFFQWDLCQIAGETEMIDRCLQGEVVLEEALEIFGTTSLLIAFVWYGHHRVTALVNTVRVRGGVS